MPSRIEPSPVGGETVPARVEFDIVLCVGAGCGDWYAGVAGALAIMFMPSPIAPIGPPYIPCPGAAAGIDGAACAGADANRLARSSMPPVGCAGWEGVSSKSIRETACGPEPDAPLLSSGGMGFDAALKSPFLYAS